MICFRNLAYLATALVYAGLLNPCPVLAQSFDDPTAVNNPEPAGPAPWTQNPGVLPPRAYSGNVREPGTNGSVGFSFGETRGIGSTGYGGNISGNTNTAGQLTGKAPDFDQDDYLQGVGAGRPLFQEKPDAQNTARIDYRSPWNKGFFEGKIDPNDKMQDIQKYLRVGPMPTHEDPAWAKQKLKMRYFQDNQEHHGNDDPYGFFNQ